MAGRSTIYPKGYESTMWLGLIPIFDTSLIARFWSKVEVLGPTDCWEWRNYKKFDGYGRFKVEGHLLGAHVVAWCLANEEPLPPAVVRHTCNNPPCCNPAHLRKGTHKSNARDREQDDRHRVNHKIKCSKGHTDIYWNQGVPHCRECRRAL